MQTNFGDYGLTMTGMAMKYGLGERRLLPQGAETGDTKVLTDFKHQE